jgi:hypothetical protein
MELLYWTVGTISVLGLGWWLFHWIFESPSKAKPVTPVRKEPDVDHHASPYWHGQANHVYLRQSHTSLPWQADPYRPREELYSDLMPATMDDPSGLLTGIAIGQAMVRSQNEESTT